MKIISGAQTGADIAGLKAAKDCGLETGGWIPAGFKTQDGKKPQYAELYNIKEHGSNKYPPRTYANVKDSEATIRFAKYWDSPGERCTLSAIKQYNKLHKDVDFGDFDKVEEIKNFISQFDVVNIAGNSENTCPGMENFVHKFMSKVLQDAVQSEAS